MKLGIDLGVIRKNVYFQKYKSFLIPGISLLISILILALIIAPTFYSYIKTQNDIKKLVAERNLYAQKLTELQSVNSSQYQNNISVLLKILPDSKDIPESLSYLLNALSTNQLRLENVSFADSAMDGGTSFTMKVDINGSLLSLRNFLNGVANMPRLMKVTGLEFSTADGQNVVATVTLAVYYKKLPQEIPSVEQSLPKITANDEKLIEQLKTQFNNNPSISVNPDIPVGKSDPFQ